jgi:uncharacterized membrane protein
MPVWILIVVIAQLLNAIVTTIDKFILTSKKVPDPFTYAFYITLFSFFAIFLFFLGYLPFNFGDFNLPHFENIMWPNLELSFYSILAGLALFLSLFFLYSAFKTADASDVIPVVSSISAIFTFLISFVFLKQGLSPNFFYGFLLLVIGMAFLSHFRFTFKSVFCAFLSGFSFAIYYILMKVMFNNFSFDQTFFWTRIGILIIVVIILLLPFLRKKIINGVKNTKPSGGFWMILNNSMGGIAGIALLKATELGDVSVVQAMNGLQFVFLIFIAVLFGKINATLLGEGHNLADLIQKIISVCLIIFGFILLFI